MKIDQKKTIFQREISWMILCVAIFLCQFVCVPELWGGNSMGLSMSLCMSASLPVLIHSVCFSVSQSFCSYEGLWFYVHLYVSAHVCVSKCVSWGRILYASLCFTVEIYAWSAHATWQVQTLQVWKKHYNRKCSGFQLPDGISLRKIPLPGPPNNCSILCLFSRGWVEGVYTNLDLRGLVFQEDLAEPWNSTPCHFPLARPTSSS